MAEIELVIKIPEEVFNEIVSADDASHLSRAFLKGSYLYFKEALQNGIPLPKGHGKLIDVNDIEWAKHREERNYIEYDVVDWDDIQNAPTIIEADIER